MFDVAQIDALYDATQGGLPLHWCLFDKKALLPLAQLPYAVKGETGEEISEPELRSRAAQGWFELLMGEGVDGGPYEGVPLYIPSRIGLFLQLECEGYTADELRRIVVHEEWMVDNVLTVDDLAYVDDDVDQILLFAQARLESLEHGLAGGSSPKPSTEEVEKARRDVGFLVRLKETGVREEFRPVVDRHVHRVRAVNDLCRVQMLDMDRAQIKAGYSPFIHSSGFHWSAEGGWKLTGAIRWESTIRSALAEADGEPMPIRLGELMLRGDRVTTTRTLTPHEYGALWKERGIEDYLKTWSRLKGERRCLNCFDPLAPDSHEKKRFCSQRCRNAAKQRRFRERNPQAVEQAQKRYWESIELDT